MACVVKTKRQTSRSKRLKESRTAPALRHKTPPSSTDQARQTSASSVTSWPLPERSMSISSVSSTPATTAADDMGKKTTRTQSVDKSELPDSLRRVLAGQLDDLPALSSRIVRIFLSSTFTDTTLERNALIQNVYPKLKEYCREKHGLEFQVVDMRWGVRDEATDDHMTIELCETEIENCQRLSIGANFVLLLGQKYGYRPIPRQIEATEFLKLSEVIKSVPSDVNLMNKWYCRDDNSVPPAYVLQPISSILTNFNNKRNQRLMEIDQDTWWEFHEKLQRMFRKAAQVMFMARRITREQMHNYFMSITEREVVKGILTARDTHAHCLAYIRQIENVNMSAVRCVRNFMDLHGMRADNEAMGLLTTLRDEKISQCLAPENIIKFSVEWTGREGIEADSHAGYLDEFCTRMHHDLLAMIDAATERDQRLGDDTVYGEVLQHLHDCRNFCKAFQGRDELVDKIRDYIIGTSNEPLVLYGASGCGKTSLLAKAFSKVRSWLPKDCKPLLVLRFVGTSPDSSSLIPLLISLCHQIASHYGEPRDDTPVELSPLIQHFKHLLALRNDQPLVVFLDSLDQLSSANGGHALAWLPCILPPHVRFVVSTLPDYGGILETLRKIVTSPSSYIEITSLGENLGAVILRSWLRDAGRTTTSDQWEVVRKALAGCNLPLYVRLVFDEICSWKSYTSAYWLAATIHESIAQLLERVEAQHGTVLVSRALGYLTAAKSGLSEAELEDVLSIDEKVLNDVYQYHLPPVRRIPSLLWTRVRNDLPHYFAERDADGANVIDWYHRQFREAARLRYFRNINFVSELHSQLADYFSGVWGGGRAKPFKYSDQQLLRFKLDTADGAADRKVPDQPLCFTCSGSGVKRYNLRKLCELPYHLIRASRYEELHQQILFNFRWLHAKLSCLPMQSTLADFEDYTAHRVSGSTDGNSNDERDTKLLADTLRLSSSVLSRKADMLGPQVVGRLLPYYNTHARIRSLIEQCDTDGVAVNALSPAYHCLHTPGGPLQYSLEAHQFAPFGVTVTSDDKYLVSVSNVLVIWDLSTGGVFREIVPGIKGIMQNLHLSPDDKFAVSTTNNDQVVVVCMVSGDVRLITPRECGRDIIETAVANDRFVVWSDKRWQVYGLANGALLRQSDVANTAVRSIVKVHIDATDARRLCVVWKVNDSPPGLDCDSDMILELTSDENCDSIPGRNKNLANNCKINGSSDQENHDVHRNDVEGCGKGINDVKDMCFADGTGSEHAGVAEFPFHSAMDLTADRLTLYACIAISDNAVACYHRECCVRSGIERWAYSRTYDNDEGGKIFALKLSPDETHLAAAVTFGYLVWRLNTGVLINVSLPSGVRNIPAKQPLTGVVAFTSACRFLVAGVRKNLYVWTLDTVTRTKVGQLVKTLDLHFGRVIELTTVDRLNKVVSSSIDKSIKVWNFDNIMEDVHTIYRHEKPIESLHLAAHAYVCVTTTRNCVGVWNLESGKLLTTLSNSAHSSIVTHACLTADAKQVVSAESGKVLFWDVDAERVLRSEMQPDIYQMILADCDTKVLLFSSLGDNRMLCVCRMLPSGNEIYRIEYCVQRMRCAVITSDGLFLVVPAIAQQTTIGAPTDVLALYHAKTGTRLYETTPKYPNYCDYSRLIAMPTETTQVALIDDEKGNIWDVKRKSFVRSICRWNGTCTRNGRYGLYGPDRGGGLELLDLRTGRTVHTLIPRVAEGVFSVTTLFTANDRYVIYYHSGHRSVRVFRVADGRQIADYVAHAEIRDVVSTPGGASIALGAVDGSLIVLTVSDPQNEDDRVFLSRLQSREKLCEPISTDTKTNGDAMSPRKISATSRKFAAAVHVARLTSRAKLAQTSRACIIS